MYHADGFRIPVESEKIPSMLNLTPDFPVGLVWKPKQKSEQIIPDLFTRIMDLPYGYFCQEVKNG